MKKDSRLEIRIGEEDKEKLKKLAEENSRTLSNYLAALIKKAIDKKIKL